MHPAPERDWSPERYLRFEDHRTRPARDLLSAVPLQHARRVVDLGCGPGNSTELLVQRFPQAQVQGLDSSPAMIERAASRLPQATFAIADVSTWVPEAGTDLVFANALFQWIPDHVESLLRILGGLASGAVLALQVPDNMDESSHRLMAEVGREPRFAGQLAAAEPARARIPSIDAYYDRLIGASTRVEVWRTVYQHPLEDSAAIVAWFETTGLRPYVGALRPGDRDAFLEAYQARIAEAYPARPDGKVLLSFPRVFVICTR